MLLNDDGRRQRQAQQALSSPVSSKKKTEVTVTTAVEASAAVNGALQQYLPDILGSLLDGRESSVRHAALLLTSAMLREGLAHPMACLPKVIALEVDINGCAELAKAELRKHFDRCDLDRPTLRLQSSRLQLAYKHMIWSSLSHTVQAQGDALKCWCCCQWHPRCIRSPAIASRSCSHSSWLASAASCDILVYPSRCQSACTSFAAQDASDEA